MKVGKLRELLQKYDGGLEIVASVEDEEGGNTRIYSLKNEIGEGGMPSNIIELMSEEMVGY